jgi:hypothetical protein
VSIADATMISPFDDLVLSRLHDDGFAPADADNKRFQTAIEGDHDGEIFHCLDTRRTRICFGTDLSDFLIDIRSVKADTFVCRLFIVRLEYDIERISISRLVAYGNHIESMSSDTHSFRALVL